MMTFLLGIFIGVGLIGTAMLRQIAVHEGNVGKATFHSVVNGIYYCLPIYFVANSNILAYTGIVVGSTLVSAFLAHWRKDAKMR